MGWLNSAQIRPGTGPILFSIQGPQASCPVSTRKPFSPPFLPFPKATANLSSPPPTAARRRIPISYSPMATKSHKKKRPSGRNPSIKSKVPSSDQNLKPPKLTEEEREEKAAAAAAEKPKKKMKATNEIDEIFQATKSSGKKRKQQQDESVGAKKPKERLDGAKKSKKAKKGSKGRDTDDDDDDEGEKRPQRRTADGLAIYSADELGFGKSDAGGTPLCPFDCDCCF